MITLTQTGRVIGVLGAKGGVGATTLSVNLAAAIALQSDSSVSLLDANLQQPDAACLLNLRPRYSLLDLAARPGLDGNIIAACGEPVALDGKAGGKQFRLFSPPLESNLALQIAGGELASLLGTIKQFPGTLVVDLPRAISRELVIMLDLCDQIVLVVEPTVASLSAARRWIEIFADLNLPPERLLTVLSRAGGKHNEIEKQLSQELNGFPLLPLANAYDACESASIEGVPAVVKYPRHLYSKGVFALAKVCQPAMRDTVK